MLVLDEHNIWRPPSGRASCKYGGPHRPEIETVDVDWDKFDSVLDSWAQE
jgi:hypothetical protein